ncbi:MAG: zinc ribbon domain-containing protein [Christensenellales bacterium]
MALMICPECGKQVSTEAENCPNCGYKLSEHKEFEKKVATLTDIPLGSKGIFSIVVGVIVLLAGIGTVVFIWGILGIIAGLSCIYDGVKKRTKKQSGACPYCNTDIVVNADWKTVRCPSCGNLSVKTDSTLETTH